MQKLTSVMVGKTRHTFAFEGVTMWDCVKEEGRHVFQNIPECGKCGSDNLILRAFFPGNEYKYLKVLCKECRSSLTFGSPKKDPEVLYPRKDEDGEFEWEAYKEKTEE